MTANCPFCQSQQEVEPLDEKRVRCLGCRKSFQAPAGASPKRKVIQKRVAAAGPRPGTRRIRAAQDDPFAVPDLGDAPAGKPILKTTPMKTATLFFAVVGVGVLAVVGMLVYKMFSADPPKQKTKDQPIRVGTRNIDPDAEFKTPVKKPPKIVEETPDTTPDGPGPDEPGPDTPEEPPQPQTELPWPHGNVDRTRAVETFRNGIVMISTDRGTATGWVLHPRGLVVTNLSVVDRAAFIKVAWMDGTERSAGIFALYPAEHLALLELPKGTYEALPVAWSHMPNFTTQVVMLGFDPNPELSVRESMTVTLGTVSGINLLKGYGQVIMTPASVPVGNNGAPLIDLHKGGVIGVVLARSTDPSVGKVIANAIPMWRFPTEHVPEMRPDIEAIAGGPMDWYTSRGSEDGAPVDPARVEAIYADEKAKAAKLESEGKLADALLVLNEFMLRGESSLRRRDPKIAERVIAEVQQIKTRLHETSEGRWKELEATLTAGGGSLDGVVAVRDRVETLVPAHQARAGESILTILDSLILGHLAEAKELMPKEAPKPDKIVLRTGTSMEGRIIEETPEKVTLELPRGKMTFTRDQIDAIERGNLAKIDEGKAKARDAMQNALVMAYSDPVRDAVRAKVDAFGGVDATEISIGELCAACDGSAGVECDMCETLGYQSIDCPTCAAKEKSTCMYCYDKRTVKHYGMGSFRLEPKMSKGQECRNCGGDGLRFQQTCSVCKGTGRVGSVGEAVDLDLNACDENGLALGPTGKRIPCKDAYAKLKKTFSSWEKSMSNEEKAQKLGTGGAGTAAERVREIYLKIEEYAICDAGSVPCLKCRNACPKCEGGKIKMECKTCAATGRRPCIECGGVGTTLRLNSLLLRSAADAVNMHQKRMLPRLKD